MLVDLLKAAILGTVQGLTEFLPVSSTGHLILAHKILGTDDDTYGLSFDVALHMGTLSALLLYFGTRWWNLLLGGLRTLRTRSLDDDDGRLAWLIVLGTIPAAALGFVFQDAIDSAFRSPWIVATMLIAFSFVFLAAEAVGERTRSLRQIAVVDAIVIGLAQAVALIPGVSRSGATISAGLFRNIERADAATFAFLMSAPIIAGASAAEMPAVIRDFADGTYGREQAAFFAVGIVTSAIVGYIAIAFLLRFLATNTLRPFVYYRVALGLVVYAVLVAQAAM